MATAVFCSLHCTASPTMMHTLAYTAPLLSLPLPFQRIAYSKSKSDAVAKDDGTYKPRQKKKVEEEAGK